MLDPSTRPGVRRGTSHTAAWFQLVFATGAVALLVVGAWPRALVAALLVPAMFAPAVLGRVVEQRLPTHLAVQLGCFIAAGPFAGAAFGLYSALPGWDKLVHADSGVLVVSAGLALLRGRSTRWPRLLLVQGCAMAIAAGWEIVEFTSDTLFGTQAQHGNTDTMTDIIAGTVGAAAALVAFAVAKRVRPPGLPV
ncbi:hypothetical protein GCM10017714_30210 [Curtobacterium pusillum]|uniref:DUF2238 domain-containing protein n=1 Tax=Curtobacterium pusillum TaxID=69373 RepID=A0ABX2ME61_9MICO|nr:hypothetical protein [Curtobacterium pusillum]NUU13594.1 hypothetical protein [Curtobacterium pusillum]GLK32182.1 hypothetical protein GCM10017610_24670 [Curtobacterium pusillum]